MDSAATILLGFAERAAHLAPLLAAAILLGEPLARLLRFPALRQWLSGLIARLGNKLNRAQRSTATRLYRGMVALLMLLLPCWLLAALLMRPAESVQLLAVILLVALFGELLRPYSLLRLRRAARAGTLDLQSHDPAFLFPDLHARLRYQIIDAADRVALLIGASLYYLAAGLFGALTYLMLAAAARAYAPHLATNRAFGWASAGLFALLDALPRFLFGLLGWLAALATPHAQPFGALRHFATAIRSFHGWVAALLGLSLGGPVPMAQAVWQLPWAGHGTPKPEATHLTRALLWLWIVMLLWLMALGAFVYLLPQAG